MLADNFVFGEQVSWTNYHAGEGTGYAVYSGDITDAANGASEFIDVSLPNTPRKIIIPQVNIYSGEAFDRARGGVLRIHDAFGVAGGRTVRGAHRADEVRPARELARSRCHWRSCAATTAGGEPSGCTCTCRAGRTSTPSSDSRVTATMLTRAIVQRDYLRVGDLMELISERGGQVRRYDGTVPVEPVTFIGLEPAGRAARRLARHHAAEFG